MRSFKFGVLFLVLGVALIACVPQTSVVNTEYVLTTTMRDGNFVYLGVDGDINGVVNPALHAKAGERITVMLVNSGEGTHDIVFEDLQVHSDKITKRGETTSITFTVPDEEVAVEYYDSTHQKLGMRGVLLVGAAEEPPVVELPDAQASNGKPVGLYVPELAAQAFQKGGCVACHIIPSVSGAVGTIGPDLSEIGKTVGERIASGEYTGMAKTAEEYLLELIQSPDAFISPACPTGPCAKGIMPASLAQSLNNDEISSIVEFLASLPDKAVAAPVTETTSGEADPPRPGRGSHAHRRGIRLGQADLLRAVRGLSWNPKKRRDRSCAHAR